MDTPARVLITGAAGQICYALTYAIAHGDFLGTRPVILHLLEVTPAMPALQGVVMELQDCALPLLRGVVATDDLETAFTGVDYAFLVGAFPRKAGMERADLLAKNAGIFKQQGEAMAKWSSPNIKSIIVGNPANTNAQIALSLAAPKIPKENFTAMTRLDHNRGTAMLAARLGVPVQNVHNVIIWGNHSSTQYPDISHAWVQLPSGEPKSIRAAINDDAWLQGEFITSVASRGAAIIKARGFSSAMSAAKAAVDHMRSWVCGTPEGEYVSMAVPSDGSYGVPQGIVFSYPCQCKNGEYKIVQGLTIDAFSQAKLDATTAELVDEIQAASPFFK